jgi:L-alanine-DL-glutamate epimerase and related enzymes of enolase superfamily
VYALQTLEDAGIKLELIEQPVKARDLAGMRYVTERVHTPVMADESVFGPMEVIELIRLRAADIINIKLMKTGGISNAIRIADIAGMHGIECMIGCMLETSISVAAAVHVAVAKSNAITKIDLDGPSLCQFNPVDGGVIFNESEISVTDAPGPGHSGDTRPGEDRELMSPLVKIRSERDQMSAVERRIADFVLENAQLLRDYSSQQLANALGISQSSVVKFTQKLGFKGYPDLKYSVGEAIARADHGETPQVSTAADGEAGSAAGHLWRRKSEAEEATRLINAPETLQAVADAISQAGRAGKVFIIGLGEDDIYARGFA